MDVEGTHRTDKSSSFLPPPKTGPESWFSTACYSFPGIRCRIRHTLTDGREMCRRRGSSRVWKVSQALCGRWANDRPKRVQIDPRFTTSRHRSRHYFRIDFWMGDLLMLHSQSPHRPQAVLSRSPMYLIASAVTDRIMQPSAMYLKSRAVLTRPERGYSRHGSRHYFFTSSALLVLAVKM